MPTDLDALLSRTARRQLGLVTRPQLQATGLADSTIRRMVDRGRLERVGARTFRVGGAVPDERSEILAACLDLDGVASHVTAAWLHGLLPQRWGRIDVLVRTGRSRHVEAGENPWRAHATTSLVSSDVTRCGAIPTTTVERTILGLAALTPRELPRGRVIDAIECGVRTRRTSDARLWRLLEERRCRGRDGVRCLEHALAERARLGATESWLEREMLALIESAGLPMPVTQRVIRRHGAFVGRVDLLYAEAKVVIEVAGHAFHSAGEQVSADLRRALELRAEGFIVLTFTYDHVVNDPRWVLARIAEALAERAR